LNQPFFKEVYGEITLCEKVAAAKGVAPVAAKKADSKPATPAAAPAKKEKKKKADDDEEPEDDYKDEKPKEKNPLDLLPKSKLNLEEWKRFYSNNDTRPTAMKWFWEHYDPEGYWYVSDSTLVSCHIHHSNMTLNKTCSIYRLDYKYNDELKLTFMSSNLVGGFFNRLESARKYAFGSILVLGEDNKNSLAGYFVFRGTSLPFEVTDCPDYDSWKFTKCNHEDPKFRELFTAYLAWDEVVEGKKFADGKVYK
jgi:elongation factor 1-gamma